MNKTIALSDASFLPSELPLDMQSEHGGSASIHDVDAYQMSQALDWPAEGDPE